MSNYKTWRDLHLWVGLILLLPVGVIAVTGFLWNHEKTLGIKQESEHGKKEPGKKMLTRDDQSAAPALTATPGVWQQHAAGIDSALAAARQEWGSEPEIERVELKQEPGYGLIVKVKAAPAADVHPEEIVWSVEENMILAKTGEKLDGSRDWAKVVHDLHTGKFFSKDYGYFWSDSGAVALVVLGFSGVVLYLIPVFKKRAKKQKSAPAARPVPATPAAELAPQPGSRG